MLCYLILAHEYGIQERALIQRLQKTGEVLVHLDAKYKGDLPPECIETRIACKWGRYSLVEAELFLFKQALKLGASQMILLCGKSYPLIGDSQLVEKFAGPRDYISSWCLRENPWDLVWRLHGRFYPDETILQGRRRGRAWLFHKLSNFLPVPKVVGSIPLKFGGQFVGLSRTTAQFVVDYAESNPWLQKAFREVHAPDEIFIQSLAALAGGEQGGPFPRWRWQVIGKKQAPHLADCLHPKKHPLHLCADVQQLQTAMEHGSLFPFGRKFADGDQDLRDISDNL